MSLQEVTNLRRPPMLTLNVVLYSHYKSSDQIDRESWFEKVTNPKTGIFYQRVHSQHRQDISPVAKSQADPMLNVTMLGYTQTRC